MNPPCKTYANKNENKFMEAPYDLYKINIYV